ncbi:hypothetical protein [Legionella erythra]|uniref:Uncharacterized protein n=1 Tax=Legionella erythra TaxID=448 RepID=A0A0W0TM58_LEGER|nr:hypothetical protein [Legionella erythra]KTC96568.1 hypothetical protein Lery_1774 [Legionella erythra]
MIKLTSLFIGLTLLSHPLAASDVSSVTFYAANNVGEVAPTEAYKNLLSEKQRQLETTMVDIMQSHHLEQSQGENILCMYKTESDGHLAAENSKLFTSSPYQSIAEDEIFTISKELVSTLQQEAVAVFIPNEQAGSGDTIIYLNSHHYTVDDVLKRISEKLPPEYTQIYTLHFDSTYGDFHKARVGRVEWLGHQIDSSVIQAAFPDDTIEVKNGQAYLVLKDGQIVNF